ncbi:MAG: hypothetical protein JW783_06990 [Bacteroidales bacterium]|nr:hypothetical protein [Bacteroidales bacterium]MBN2748144.1 hypothetical protein [Bacteroidales bacterium]
MNKDAMDIECCPKFDSAPWDDKTFEWSNKRFVRDKVFTLFFMPMNFGPVIKRVMSKAEQSNAAIPSWLCLSDHTSKWNMDIYVAVDKDVDNAENITITGTFYSKVYEGDFNKTGEWCKNFELLVKERGLAIKKWYMWYTTCPKCAKKYGKNYVVIIAEV